MSTTTATTADYGFTADDTLDMIDFGCGHRAPRPANMQASSADRMSENGTCTACWKTQRQEVAERHATENDLPTLRGTDKQIAWATNLRHQTILELQGRIRRALEMELPAVAKKANKTLDGVSQITSAAAWIDAREVSPEALLAGVKARQRRRAAR